MNHHLWTKMKECDTLSLVHKMSNQCLTNNNPCTQLALDHRFSSEQCPPLCFPSERWTAVVCVHGGTRLCIKWSVAVTVLVYCNPPMRGHTYFCRLSWCMFGHNFVVLSVESDSFWSSGVRRTLQGGVCWDLVLSHQGYLHVITETRVLMNTPSLGYSRLLLMVQEIIWAQFVQLLLSASASLLLHKLRLLSWEAI